MAKQDAATATPKLRFPGFRDSAAWEWKTLSHVCDMQAGKFISASEISERRDEGTYPCYGGNGLRGYTSTFTHSGKYPLIGRQGALCGNVQFAQGDFYATEHALVSSTKSGINVEWLCYTLDGLELNRFATGQAQPGLSVDVLKAVPCAVPGDEIEQQKIADCLTSLDEVIAAQGRKVEALKAHKRGLMQQLFPREGETRPRLRFPEFRDAPEWTQDTLGETTDVLMCKRIFASETNPLGGVPFYKIGTLGGLPDAYITKELFEDYRSRYNFPRVGEILITCSGTVGKCLRYDGSNAYFQDSNIVWIDNPTGAISNDFLFALISNVDWSKLNSTTITRIYGPDLRGLPIKYPKDGAEQQRIADCLSSLDTQIAAESNHLAALKTHKQGLMQQLFPAP